MRRTLAIVLIAIALPLTAHASSILDVAVGPGALTYTSGPVVTGFVDSASWLSCNLGICTTVQGLVIDQGANLSLVSGNNINGPVIYHGVFTSENVITNHVNGQVEFQITGVLKGSLTAFPHSTPVFGFLVLETNAITFSSCEEGTCTIGVPGGFLNLTQTPEPGTIGLLGTGFLGIIATVRKKSFRE